MKPIVFNHFVTSLALVTVSATSVLAQGQPARGAAPPREQQQARHNIYVMEGVLERAVEYGGDQVRRQVRRVMPDMLLMSGAAEARGVRLDGYGVFFDVAVPVLRRSVAWTLKTMMEDNGPAMTSALQQLKGLVDRVGDPREKANLQQAIRRIELQVAPVQPVPSVLPGAPPRGAVTSLEAAEPMAAGPPPTATGAPGVPPIDPAILTNPSEAYEKEVITALIDAMLDHGGTIGVGGDEWLTVAARDNEQRDRLTPGDSYDLMTIILRIKGSDIAAYRADRITKEEARKRIEIREF